MNIFKMLFGNRDKDLPDGNDERIITPLIFEQVFSDSDIKKYVNPKDIMRKRKYGLLQYLKNNFNDMRKKGTLISHDGKFVSLHTDSPFRFIDEGEYNFSYSIRIFNAKGHMLGEFSVSQERIYIYGLTRTDYDFYKTYSDTSENDNFKFLYDLFNKGNYTENSHTMLFNYAVNNIDNDVLDDHISKNPRTWFKLKTKQHDCVYAIFYVSIGYDGDVSYNNAYYEFSEWKTLSINVDDILDIEICDDPQTEHWEHFVNLDIQRKQESLIIVYNHVKEVMDKYEKYNEIYLSKNIVPPIAPINDYQSYIYFTNNIHHPQIGCNIIDIENAIRVVKQNRNPTDYILTKDEELEIKKGQS